MKKTIKILTIILTIFTFLFIVAQPTSFAEEEDDTTEQVTSVDSITGKIEPKKGLDQDTSDEITNVAGTITGALWVASIVISVCVLVYIGIMYIMGSPSKKADYKATLTPLIVGIGLVVLATSIINFIFGGFEA